ncbi:Uncharacterized protein SAPIO_CDS7605 [Scedosporium apiospermum]|uniref:Uncharacterized protein n=1 Tax=Pseudallescheria apiosperma TaxID=563466 RepID=A0A084G2A2_PSEDA|nr:Uncharacterized protein SAPIO_CDS7605 [Scedosporium apiospermum]KEZ41464.1 Uncharacterized protein SAPIO_CDS7605 [Scedosporium apiospermum]
MDIRSLITDEDGDHVFNYSPPRSPVFPHHQIDTKSEDAFRTSPVDELTSIVNTSANNHSISSNPVSPGPPSPPLDQPKSADFVPPVRPSSTPFLRTEPLPLLCHDTDLDDAYAFSPDASSLLALAPDQLSHAPTAVTLNSLPTEIHEAILDHLFGFRVSPQSKSSVDLACVTKPWGTLHRYSRRKEISQLALVSQIWRPLIQSRLYRHIKIQGTQDSLVEVANFFLDHPHLVPYIKHLEVWFPVFQPRRGQSAADANSTPTVSAAREDGLATAANYKLPYNNACLRQVFDFMRVMLPGVSVLTLEGGERRKAPKVRNEPAHRNEIITKTTPSLLNVRTLVTKGQWNLLRDDVDFSFIMTSFPNLVEWHGSYSRPKSKSYLSMARFLPNIPSHVTHLSLFLEADYRREMSTPTYALKVANQVDFCRKLAEATPSLEHLSYTGRICRSFFEAAALKTNPRLTRLKSIDLTVKNICRTSDLHSSGTGIFDILFIQNFEALVLAAIRSMDVLTALQFLRIRYVDLESAVPPLNPYFLMRDGKCTGVWSEALLRELGRVRPMAQYEELTENFGDLAWNKDGRLYVSTQGNRLRVRSLKISSYRIIQIPALNA